jgi:hypothetical protein
VSVLVLVGLVAVATAVIVLRLSGAWTTGPLFHLGHHKGQG